MIKAIADRRTRILQAFLPRVNPINDPAIDQHGRLTFRNIAVEAGTAKASEGYRALWYLFDNATDRSTLVETTGGAQSPLPMPPMPDSEFIKVDISATSGPDAWTRPVSAYFRRQGGRLTLVGLERLP